MSKPKFKWRVVECINVVWECEAPTMKEAREMYYTLVADAVEFQRMVDEGSSDIEVFKIDDEGNCV